MYKKIAPLVMVAHTSILPKRAIFLCCVWLESCKNMLKVAQRTERFRKSDSGRLGLRILTAERIQSRNLETTAIGETVRSRSVLLEHLTFSYKKNKGAVPSHFHDL